MADHDPDLEAHLRRMKPTLAGAWVNANSGYEGALSALLEMTEERSRYWDARWRGRALEFKKGHSIWLDLVRYAEVQLGSNAQAREETATLFFLPDKPRQRIKEVVCVETRALIRHLGITTQEAVFLGELAARMKGAGRNLNAQASLRVPEARKIAAFFV
jgi:hypothetical protein